MESLTIGTNPKIDEVNNYRLISAILGSAFLIEEKYAHSFMPGMARLLNHEAAHLYQGEVVADLADKIEEQNRLANRDFVVTIDGAEWSEIKSGEVIPPNSVHVVQIRGAVMKDDWCGVPGTKTIKEQLLASKENPNIIGAVFVTETGGGQVDGTFELVDVIANYGKPMVNFVDGTSCSAGYAIGSRCKEIKLSHNTAMVGSIGTAISFWNFTKYYEEMGIELIYRNAKSSPDKNQDYFEALEGKFELLDEDLEYLNQIFKSSVKAGRPGIKDEAMTGKCFRGNKAISLGMADSIGSLEDAINRVEELANK